MGAKKSNRQRNQVILSIVTSYLKRNLIGGGGLRSWEPGIFCGFHVIVSGELLPISAGEPDKRSIKSSQWPKSF